MLHGLAPYISPRSDTFVIRSLGEARDTKGEVVNSVRLEAVVQRVPDWVDPVDDKTTALAELKSEVNKTFGRRSRWSPFARSGLRSPRLREPDRGPLQKPRIPKHKLL